MEITIKEENGVSILNLKGRLDLASGNGLKDQIKNLMEQEKVMVHLNLAEVDFINSSGLGILVSLMKEIRLHRGRLTLSNLVSYVQEIFEITQLSRIFEIFSSQEEALNSFQTVTTG